MKRYPFKIRDEHVIFWQMFLYLLFATDVVEYRAYNRQKSTWGSKLRIKVRHERFCDVQFTTVRPIDSVFLFTERNQNFLPCKMEISYFARISFRIFLM